MTSHEFQQKYHEYQTSSKERAMRDAAAIKLSDGHTVVAVQIGNQYCLMLKTAADMMAEDGTVTILPGVGEEKS